MYRINVSDYSDSLEFSMLQKMALVTRYQDIVETNKLFNYNVFTNAIEGLSIEGIKDILLSYYNKKKGYVAFADNNRIYVVPKEKETPVGYVMDIKVRTRNDFLNIRSSVYYSDKRIFEDVKSELKSLFSDKLVDGTFTQITWIVRNAKGELSSYYFNELLNDTVHPEAYPFLSDMDGFISEYFESSAAVLFLLGKPGTGKTRFIRYTLQKYATMYNKEPEVLYASSQKPLEIEEVFARFLEHDYNFMILEDADRSLESRTGGNKEMSSILTAADGLVQNLNKKIIITSNLPNLNDVDQALVRPGRCFEKIEFPLSLTREEYVNLLEAISDGKYSSAEAPTENELDNPKVADVYKLYHTLEHKQLV